MSRSGHSEKWPIFRLLFAMTTHLPSFKLRQNKTNLIKELPIQYTPK